MRLALAFAALFTVIGTIVMIDRGPSAQQEAEDFSFDPVAIPASYVTTKATTDAAAAVLAERIAQAYAAGKEAAYKEGCRRKMMNHPLERNNVALSQ